MALYVSFTPYLLLPTIILCTLSSSYHRMCCNRAETNKERLKLKLNWLSRFFGSGNPVCHTGQIPECRFFHISQEAANHSKQLSHNPPLIIYNPEIYAELLH